MRYFSRTHLFFLTVDFVPHSVALEKSMKFTFSAHALQECDRRGIRLDIAQSVLNNPQQIVPEKFGRQVYQSQIVFEKDRSFLLRIVVDTRVKPYMVITVYRTSKIDKYWRRS